MLGRKYQQFVPCGKCAECIKDKQNEYMIRTVEEGMKVGNIWFFTLTYNEESVPKFDVDGEIDEETGEVECLTLRSIKNKDIVDWKKRVKRNIEYHSGQKLNYSYLICGEYGPKTHRPHYHGLFMGLTDEQVNKFKQDWESKYGYTCFKRVPRLDLSKVGKYVVKYITKVREVEDPYVLQGLVEKPRKITSVGYGRPTEARLSKMKKEMLCDSYLHLDDIDNINRVPVMKLYGLCNRIADTRHYHLDGRDYKFPSYYKRLIFYVKDKNKNVLRASALQRMVSKTLQTRIREEFSRKLQDLATEYSYGGSYQEMHRISKMLCDSEMMNRQDRAKAILEVNFAAARKSRF